MSLICLLLGFQLLTAQAQEDSITVRAGDYSASKLKKTLFGRHYRAAWNTPVTVPFIDIEKEQLKPIKLGGGFQTKSLRLEDKNGQQFVFRSVNKDVSKIIPEPARFTLAHDIVQDQISASHPYGALVVPTLAEAAGVAHAKPTIAVVKDSENLGEHKETFGNMLVLFEQRPYGDMSDLPNFNSAPDVESTPKVLEKTQEHHHHQVDEHALIRARLLDILLGDIDRHDDQWRWSKHKSKDFTLYRPIPRDRDFDFLKADVMIPWLVLRKWAFRMANSFDYEIKDVVGLGIQGMKFDRTFLTRMEKQDWVRAADSMRLSFSDEVIESAFTAWPKEIYQIDGPEIIAKLKARRDKLSLYAEQYYEELAKNVDIRGTDGDDYFKVERIHDDSTRVRRYKGSKIGKKEQPSYERTFITGETKEIRLYGLDEEDTFELIGETKKGILIRVIGGDDEDKVLDKSSVAGSRRLTHVYDTRGGNQLELSPESRIRTANDTLVNFYDRGNYKLDVLMPAISLGYTSDNGLYFGGGFVHTHQGFRKAPFASRNKLVAMFATGSDAIALSYQGNFTDVLGKWDFELALHGVSPDFQTNYFGYGNETVRLNPENEDYHRFGIGGIDVKPRLIIGNKDRGHSFQVGPDYQSIYFQDLDARSPGRFIDEEANLPTNSFEDKRFLGLHAQYDFDRTDHPVYPKMGFRFSAQATGYTALGATVPEQNFARLRSELDLYIPIIPLQTVVAGRIGAATNVGEFEFYQANTLGGQDMFREKANLRGYNRDRFSGRSYFFQNLELRTYLLQVRNYVLPFWLGVSVGMDNGRVWTDDESSSTWHQGFGAGIWIIPFPDVLFTVSRNSSKEDDLWGLSFGFRF